MDELSRAEFLEYAKFANVIYFKNPVEHMGELGLDPDTWEMDGEVISVPARVQNGATSLKSIDSNDSMARFYANHLQTARFIHKQKSEMIISIRGSYSLSDFSADVELTSSGCSVPKVLCDCLNGALDYFSNYDITLVGHSLGGYMAIKLFLTLSKDIDRLKVVAFDSPGIEKSLHDSVTQEQKKRIFIVLPGPHLINSVHRQLGEIWHLDIPFNEPKTVVSAKSSWGSITNFFYSSPREISFQEGFWNTQIRYFIVKLLQKHVEKALLQQMRLDGDIPQILVTIAFDQLINRVSPLVDVSQRFLKELRRTLALHPLDQMIEMLQQDSSKALTKINAERWPEFCRVVTGQYDDPTQLGMLSSSSTHTHHVSQNEANTIEQAKGKEESQYDAVI